MSKLAAAIAIMFGNFVFQYFELDADYMIAIERSYFQGIAMLALCWIPRPKSEGSK